MNRAEARTEIAARAARGASGAVREEAMTARRARILYLHRTREEGVEGVHIREMARALVRRGAEVRILGPRGESRAMDERRETGTPAAESATTTTAAAERADWRVRAFRLLSHHAPAWLFELSELAWNIILARRLRRQRADRRPDAIYERYAQGALAGARHARRSGIPFVVEVNYSVDTPIVRRRTRILRPLMRRIERRVLRSADVIVVISRAMQRILTTAHDLPAERFLLLPNAADPARFRPGLPPPDAIAARVAGRTVIGFVGGFYRWHGLDALLAAFAALPEAARRTTVLLLIGDGPEHDAVRRHAHDLGIADAVLLPGRVPHAALPDWTACFDIAVVPDIAPYASPMKLFEYWASGAAVIAAATEPIRDLLAEESEEGEKDREEDEAAILIPPSDAAALRAAVAALIADPDRRRRIAARGRALIERRYNWNAHAEKLLARLETLKRANGADGRASRPPAIPRHDTRPHS